MTIRVSEQPVNFKNGQNRYIRNSGAVEDTCLEMPPDENNRPDESQRRFHHTRAPNLLEGEGWMTEQRIERIRVSPHLQLQLFPYKFITNNKIKNGT